MSTSKKPGDSKDWMLGDEWMLANSTVLDLRPRRQKRWMQGGETSAGIGFAKITRLVRKAPEVVVRVTGGANGSRGVKEHLAYITRNGELEAERESGDLVNGKADVKDVAEDWWTLRGGTDTIGQGEDGKTLRDRKQTAASEADASRARGPGEHRPKRTRDTINMVLSMPVGTDPDKLHSAAREFAQKEFGGKNDYMLVLHRQETDPYGKTSQPHVHLTVKNCGFDGRMLSPNPDDLQRYRERFASLLRSRGVVAEATPRASRGVAQKAPKQAEYHMRKQPPKQGHKTATWRIDRARILIGQGVKQDDGPWKKAAEEKRKKIDYAWRVIQRELEKRGETALALQVDQYRRNLAPVETQLDRELKKQIDKALDRGR